MTQPEINVLNVFPGGLGGGNPAPIVTDASGLDAAEMKAIATRYGYESGFVFPAGDKEQADFQFRFFVPNHEMEMCGHATIGALWALRDQGSIAAGNYRIETLSGLVEADVPEDGPISISQPEGRVEKLAAGDRAKVLEVLRIAEGDLVEQRILNAATSRVKTLVPLASLKRLHSITPDFSRIKEVCESIGSTGLYPFAYNETIGQFSARQFPRASGYPEDAATGIAATALAFGLLVYKRAARGDKIIVNQGEAMGHPSRIAVSLREDGCILTGSCEITNATDAPKTEVGS